MLALIVLVALGWLGWLLTRHIASFPAEFAQLLDRPERRGGLASLFTGRSHVTGEFQGRAVTLEFERASEHQTGYAIVAMAVEAPNQSPIQVRSSSPPSDADRELDKALFALEGKHELGVAIEAGWLSARWMPVGFFMFPGRFDRAKWRDVIENLSRVAGGLERQSGRPAFQRPSEQAPLRTAGPLAHTAATPATSGRPSSFAARLAVRSSTHRSASPGAAGPRDSGRGGLVVLRLVAWSMVFVGAAMLVASAPLLGTGEGAGGFARTSAVLAAILLVSGSASLIAARNRPVPSSRIAAAADISPTPFGGWLWLLLASTVVLPVWMVTRLGPLWSLWVDMLRFFGENGVWDMPAGGGELSGVVLLPVFGVLSVPALHIATAFGFVAGALLLLPLLLARSPRFPRAFLAFVLLQAGLAASAQYTTIAAAAAGRFVESELSNEPESSQIEGAIARYGETLRASAWTLTWAAVGFAVWTPVLLSTERFSSSLDAPRQS